MISCRMFQPIINCRKVSDVLILRPWQELVVWGWISFLNFLSVIMKLQESCWKFACDITLNRYRQSRNPPFCVKTTCQLGFRIPDRAERCRGRKSPSRDASSSSSVISSAINEAMNESIDLSSVVGWWVKRWTWRSCIWAFFWHVRLGMWEGVEWIYCIKHFYWEFGEVQTVQTMIDSPQWVTPLKYGHHPAWGHSHPNLPILSKFHLQKEAHC